MGGTRAAAEAALKLDSNSARAHAVLVDVYLEHDWNWSAAQRESKTAVALAPHDPFVLQLAQAERFAVGQWSEALRFLDAAITADPLDANLHSNLGALYLRLGRLFEAESAARRVLEISPTYSWGHTYLGYALLIEGKATEALAEMQKEREPGAQVLGLALVNRALRRTLEADAALARLTAEHAGDMAMLIAEVYAFRGQKDRAFEWLDRAYAQKDINLYYIKSEVLFDSLKPDPRYKAFLRKMNLPE